MQELAPYAVRSLPERMATRILEREELGYTRWTPQVVYAEVQKQYPDLYPAFLPENMLEDYRGEDFIMKLAKLREQRMASRLPGYVLADVVGRRIIDLGIQVAIPILEEAVYALAHPEEEKKCPVALSEVRLWMKDALTYVNTAEDKLRETLGQGKEQGKEKPTVTREDMIEMAAGFDDDRVDSMAALIGQNFKLEVMKRRADRATVVDVQGGEE